MRPSFPRKKWRRCVPPSARHGETAASDEAGFYALKRGVSCLLAEAAIIPPYQWRFQESK